jgi:hypothetical protein
LHYARHAKSDHLELITLNDTIASFSRLFANTVRYHHWHQCLEILYVEEGFGVAIVDNRHYTMRPGRLFFFPPFTLHKVMVDEQAEAIYRRTIIHLDPHAVLKVLRDFPQTLQRLQKALHAVAAKPGWRMFLPVTRTLITCWVLCKARQRPAP